jgi:hypothetical protein
MSSSFVAQIATRFSHLNFTNAFGFPNAILDIKVSKYILPNFREYVDENPAQHLFEFHKIMDQLDIHHEDFLMKLFMFSLGGDTRLSYKSLIPSHISSLKEFHVAFHKYYKRVYSSEFLFEDCWNIKFTKHICEESEHDSNYGQIHEEEFTEKQDLIQIDQEYL